MNFVVDASVMIAQWLQHPKLNVIKAHRDSFVEQPQRTRFVRLTLNLPVVSRVIFLKP